METIKTQYNNQKATMVIMNSLGLVVVRKVMLQSSYLKAPYQGAYKKNLAVTFIEKGKRKPSGYAYEQVAIFDGWQGDDFKLPIDFTIGEFSNNNYEKTKSQFQNLIIEHISK